MLNKFSLPIFEKRMLLVALLSSAFTLILILAMAILTYGPFTKNIRFIIVMYMSSHLTVSTLGHSTNFKSLIASYRQDYH